MNDIKRLQMDLHRIAKWKKTWLMEFNVGKCFAMRVGRQRGRSKMDPPMYKLHGQVLCITDTTKYLGLTITSDMKWNSHIQKVTSRANSVLGLLRWSLRIASKAVKTQAYEASVRPHLEYACTVWDPHTQVNVRRLDSVRRRAAHYVCNRWHNTSSVSTIIPHNDTFKFSFIPRTIIAWNALPPVVVDCVKCDCYTRRRRRRRKKKIKTFKKIVFCFYCTFFRLTH